MAPGPEVARGPVPCPAPPCVAALVLAFWRHAEAHYRHADGSQTGEIWILRVALRPLRKLYGSTVAADFGPLALRAVREEMVRSGLARTSVNARINRIRRAFKWGESVVMIPPAVHAALATVPGLQAGRTEARETTKVGPVSAAAVEAVLPLVTRPVAAMVRPQLLTGMRPGEDCSMRSGDLTPGEGTWTYRPRSHKSAHRDKSREIALGPRAIELVKGFLRADLDAYLFDPREAVAEHQAARSGARKTGRTPSEVAKKKKAGPAIRFRERYSKSSYRNAIVRACDRAFLHPSIVKRRNTPLEAAEAGDLVAWKTAHRWHPNQLRHSAATEVRARFGLEAAQVVLGHARADVTQTYAERDLAKARELMKEIG